MATPRKPTDRPAAAPAGGPATTKLRGTPAATRPPRASRAALQPKTLAIDIGGTGLKAALLDWRGRPLGERVRVDTTYPCPPDKLLTDLAGLGAQLPGFDRISAGFPGVVRAGRVRSAPHFVTLHGPGTKISKELTSAWENFDLAGGLEAALGRPVRVANDADLQGAAVVKGDGLELVITLGTGLGTAVYYQGALAPHLELAHHPFRKNETYNEQLGDAARAKIGNRKWNSRVGLAISQLYALFFYDHLYIGGGNSRRVTIDLGPSATIVDNSAGVLGGIRLWSRPIV
ncbi:MAG TPA: ROK family protein [Mycobacteriales bacterium]|nr:ROK family protein [Mycobacteriales bacterium]